MYSIGRLTPETALQYESLAPFEVRPVLHLFGYLRRVHAFGASLMGRPIGLAIAVRGWAEPGAFGGAAPAATSARVLTLTVARSYRRIGAGRALLSALEASLTEDGVTALSCNYALESAESLAAVEGLFASAGWSAPEVAMVQCRAEHGILESPIMKDRIALPPEYQIVDWVDLTRTDRESILARQRAAEWYPATLDPFHFEPEMEPLNSLALRYEGEVVGWLITRRTSALNIHYLCLFVRTDLARLGRGVALIAEAVRRHHTLVGSRPAHGAWSTPSYLPAMIRFIKRHFVPFGTHVVEQRVVKKALVSRARADETRAPRAVPTRKPLLGAGECDGAVLTLTELRAAWKHRTQPIEFDTLGAVASIDAFASNATYLRAAARDNPLLSAQFGTLYERLLAALGDALGAPAQHREEWGLPAFRFQGPSRGANVPLGAVHCDVDHAYLAPGAAVGPPPVSFTVLLSEPDETAWLRLWDLTLDETTGLDTEETARLLDGTPSENLLLGRGELLLYPSHRYHQRAPLPDLKPGRLRITLEGHAVHSEGSWQVFG
ncbi:MAG TPA: GNAT family N-acetyltransferase [Gemmatimonadaceae bacterium]|nr:GNAT family N-acetyltransferase [Gemmatimonadaceae bacterium]